MDSRGERELRGERRGKGGRSLLVAAAPSFFIPLVLLTGELNGQRPEPQVRLGVLGSSTLVEAEVAAAALRQQFPGLGASPQVSAATGPVLSGGVRLRLRKRTSLNLLAGWQFSELRVEDAGGTRALQSLGIWHALVGMDFTPKRPLQVSGGAGVLGYRADREGVFAEGSNLMPLLRLEAGASRPLADHLLTLRAVGYYHRFDTDVIRSAGGESGGVFRYGLEAGFIWGGSR